jgi:RNA polymerase sigma-70 factor (ECF subfamily)
MIQLESNHQNHKTNSKQMQEFEHLLNPILNQLYGLSLTLARNPHDAEDLVQLTCLKAWRAFDTFNPGNFKKWITTILFNNFINLSRKRKRQPYFIEIDTLAGFLTDTEESGEDILLNGDYDLYFADEVSEALDRLPEKYRIVVLLCDVVGMQYKEIADVIKAPIGTIMSRLHRGRRILAQNLVTYASTEYGYLLKA